MKMYQSKKNTEITARLESMDEKYNTVLMVYETGPDVGKSFSITTSTLKRWWRLVNDDTPNSILNIDDSVVNTKYPEPKEQKYIPKPKSVIEYEAKKGVKYNNDLPTHEEIAETFAPVLNKINKTYVVFKNGCWLERKSGYINLYSNEEVWQILTDKGFQFRPNGMKNTKLNFVLKINTIEDYEIVSEVLRNV